MVRVVNKFKADFGGQIVALERVQQSADHVPHRFVFFFFSFLIDKINKVELFVFLCMLHLEFLLF
jgi:hypothetical protein